MVTRRSFIKKSLAGSAYIVLAVPAIGTSATDEIWFVHLTDTHIGENEQTAANLRYVLNDIAEEFPKAEFLAVTGDITEHGWEEELKRTYQVMEKSTTPYYNVMGNHDSRWSRTGRRAFVEQFGNTRWAIEHPLVNIYLIDSSVLLEQYGYLDPSELDWLENHLRDNNHHPSLIGFHHPPGTERNFIGSERALFDLVSRYNIPVIMAGHVHTPRQYNVNGTWIVTSGATHPPERGYTIFRADDRGIHLYTRDPVNKLTEYVQKIEYDKTDRNTPPKNKIDIGPVERKNRNLYLQIPSALQDNEITVQLSGVTLDHTDSNGRIVLDTEKIGSGNYEVMVSSPHPGADNQQRAWGEAKVTPPKGLIRWTNKLEAGTQCRPAFYNKIVVTGCNNGNLYGIDRLTGEYHWKRKTGQYEILSGPCIKNGKIFFGTMDEHVHCTDALTGELRWRIPVQGSVIATGMFARDMYVVGTGQGILYAINVNDGEVLWKFETGNLIKATPAWDGEYLYFGSWDGYFYCIDGTTGKLKWRKYINVPHFAPATSNPKLYDGRIFFVSHDYRTHCFDAKTGDVIWQFPPAEVEYDYRSPIIQTAQPSYSSAIFYNKRVYFCSITGHVVGFDIDTGTLDFEYALDAPVFDSFPVIVDTNMYFGTIRGTVWGIDLQNKKRALKHSLGYEYIFSPPAAKDRELVIGSLGGTIAYFNI